MAAATDASSAVGSKFTNSSVAHYALTVNLSCVKRVTTLLDNALPGSDYT